MAERLISFVQLSGFTASWAAIGMGDDDLIALERAIAADPAAAPVMRETNGLRKIRFAPEGRGKGGAHRVCYFFYQTPGIVVLVRAFAKKDQANLTGPEKRAIRKLSAEIEREFNRG